jgi:hypothetical protein
VLRSAVKSQQYQLFRGFGEGQPEWDRSRLFTGGTTICDEGVKSLRTLPRAFWPKLVSIFSLLSMTMFLAIHVC